MKFRFTADATFDADDIVVAFEKLGRHFSLLASDDNDGPMDSLEFIGEMNLEPEE